MTTRRDCLGRSYDVGDVVSVAHYANRNNTHVFLRITDIDGDRTRGVPVGYSCEWEQDWHEKSIARGEKPRARWYDHPDRILALPGFTPEKVEELLS